MNYLLAIALLFMVGSCSKDTSIEDEEPIGIEYRSRLNQKIEKKTQEIFEIDLNQYHVLSQIAQLEEQKKQLAERIDAGDEKSLYHLELVIDKLRTNYHSLDTILENTCTLLKIRAAFLEMQISRADGAALGELLKELSEIAGKLEKCGIDVEDYFAEIFEEKGIMYVMSWGSRCDPGREWKCKNVMEQGKLLLNVEEKLANSTEVRFKSQRGEEISTGRMVGYHEQLRGIAQFEVDLKEIENGLIEISTENGLYEIPIEVR